MSEAKETADDSQKEQLGDAALISPASPTESSPLSSPPQETDVKTAEVHKDETADGARKSASACVTPAHEDSAKDEATPLLECPNCEKTYSSEKGLKRHINDKKSKCFKARESNDDIMRWTCPRCNVQLEKKRSVARHIKDSCWKICDECCENHQHNCNAHNMEGNCNNCEEAGKPCTKHTEPMADCVPELQTAEPDKPPNKKKSTGKKKSEKRKEAKSPETSPKAKPQAKSRRVTQRPREEDLVFDLDEANERVFGTGHDDYSSPPAAFLRAKNQSSNRFQPPQMDRTIPHESRGRQMIDAAVRSGRQLPPPPGYELSSNAPAAPYHSELSEMLARQVQAVQGMSQYTSGYGGSMRPAYATAVMSSTRSSLNLGQNDPRVVPQPRGDGNGGGGARTMLSGPPQACRRPNQLGGARRNMAPLVVPPPMHQSRPRQQYAAATQPRLNASSRQPLAQDPRSSPNDMLSNQTGTAGGINRDDNERKQLMVKLPLSRELKSKFSIALPPQPSPAHPQNPVIRLRIHSNTFDPNGQPIFSILTLHLHDEFGPRLQYYSHYRGRVYGVDWKFIYSYAAPTPQQPGRRRYFDLTWKIKPAMCHDSEYPGADMRDGDTIFVAARRVPVPPNVVELNPDHFLQLPADIVAIQPGEVSYQSLAVNAMWYSHAENELKAARQHVEQMENAMQQARIKMEKCEDAIAELEARNAALVWELRGARGGGAGDATGSHFVNRQNFAASGPAYRQQGPVRDAADKVATGEEEDDDHEMEM